MKETCLGSVIRYGPDTWVTAHTRDTGDAVPPRVGASHGRLFAHDPTWERSVVETGAAFAKMSVSGNKTPIRSARLQVF